MALSSEIEDLEEFIDSYVGPESRTSSSTDWSRTHSFDNNPDFATSQHPHYGSTPPQHDTGTEFWGKKPDGPQWSAPQQTRASHDGWGDHRPKVQERQVVHQWQQPGHQSPDYQQPHVQFQQQHYQPHMDPSQLDGHQLMQQLPSHLQNPQNPNDIQALVSNLIRHNNMTKPQQLPPWVDVTKPPPTFHTEYQSQYSDYMQPQEPYTNPLDLQAQEPILHSMTFQRSYPDQGFGEAPVGQAHLNREASPMPPYHFEAPHGSAQPYMGEWPHQAQNMTHQGQMNFASSQYQENAISNLSRQLHADRFQSPVDIQQASHPGNNYQYPLGGVSNQQPQGEVPLEVNNQPPRSRTQPAQQETPPSKAALSQKSSNEKYPKSKLRSPSDGTVQTKDTQAAANSNHPHAHQRQLSSEVFENESDNQWRTNNLKVQVNFKNSRRRSSAADEDPDWRKRSSSESDRNVSKDSDYDHRSSADFDARQVIQRRQKGAPPNRNSKDENRHEQPASRGRVESTTSSEGDSHRRVTAKGKLKVHSWLQNGNSSGNVEEGIKRLEITDSETDLTKFIEATQSFATNESKMREVAEILCNKALKNPKFARNASILCDRMSWLMVHGTKFRTVVLNVMQGHYKNRDHLFSASFRSDTRWFGFVTFLTEIFLNVRTSTKDRLVVLVEPVFSCLFQVLKSEQVDVTHIECFGNLFARAGPALESENTIRMNKLMAEIRDRCVISKTSFIRKVLLHCVELYATKWDKGNVR